MVAVLALCPLEGCYERVVRAKGFGADQMNVQKPYASDTVLDRTLMGPVPASGERKVKSSSW
jgi:hypothetical protein